MVELALTLGETAVRWLRSTTGTVALWQKIDCYA
jgi:hypothetical protein